MKRYEQGAAQRAASKAARDAQREAENAFVGEWFAAHPDAAAKREALPAGTLRRHAELLLIADAEFADAGAPDVSRPMDYPDCDLIIELNIPDEIAVRAAALRARLLPHGGKVDCFTYWKCARKKIYLAKVALRRGPFTFMRTVELP
jgi:hypothetical protein